MGLNAIYATSSGRGQQVFQGYQEDFGETDGASDRGLSRTDWLYGRDISRQDREVDGEGDYYVLHKGAIGEWA